MKTIKVNTILVNKVASKYGVSPEEYIADSLSVSSGQTVCAHYIGAEGDLSVFSISR